MQRDDALPIQEKTIGLTADSSTRRDGDPWRDEETKGSHPRGFASLSFQNPLPKGFFKQTVTGLRSLLLEAREDPGRSLQPKRSRDYTTMLRRIVLCDGTRRKGLLIERENGTVKLSMLLGTTNAPKTTPHHHKVCCPFLCAPS